MDTSKLQTGDVLAIRHIFVWYKPIQWYRLVKRYFEKHRFDDIVMLIWIWDRLFVLKVERGRITLIPFKNWNHDLEFMAIRLKLNFGLEGMSEKLMHGYGKKVATNMVFVLWVYWDVFKECKKIVLKDIYLSKKFMYVCSSNCSE